MPSLARTPLLLLALSPVALLPSPLAAANCLDRVREVAAARGISTDPPTVAPGGTRRPSSDDLARSGGVVEPPAGNDRSVITPPRDHSGMPTLPEVAPPAAGRPAPHSDGLDAAERSTLQALLVAARAQGERGREAECLEGLRKAEDLLSRHRP